MAFNLIIDKEKLLNETSLPNFFEDFQYLSVPIKLIVGGEVYMDKSPTYTDRVMFFTSIPHKKEFVFIKEKNDYEMILVDGLYDIDLNFSNDNSNKTVRVTIKYSLKAENDEFILNSTEFFFMIDQMWIDLVDVLYQVYPKELVDQEMDKIYKKKMKD